MDISDNGINLTGYLKKQVKTSIIKIEIIKKNI